MTAVALELLAAPDRLNQQEPGWRREARLAALDWLSTNAMPTRSDEAWHYTRVEPLLELLGSATRPHRDCALDPRQIDHLAGDHGGSRLVFVNGHFARSASRILSESGISVAPFSKLGRNAPVGPTIQPLEADGFVALSWLAGDDGAAIQISSEAASSAPIHIVHVAVPELDDPVITHPNTVVQLAPGAQGSIIESFVSFPGIALTNAATTIDVGDRASLTYYRVQDEAGLASHVGHAQIRVGQAAHLKALSCTLGAATSRVAFDIKADGDGSNIEVDGLYVPSGNEHHDHVVTLDHAASHTTSSQRFKGVIDDRAHGAFTGHVIVRPGTIDSSATQANHSLLLSRTAESDSRPWLEILADDVRCTHGATVGRLDDEALFYLRSRGIPADAARRLLIDGFTSEIIAAIDIDSLSDHLLARITAKQRRSETNQ